MENKEIENIKLLVMEIIGYANGVMVDKVDTKMHRYFNEKASEVNNKIDEALKELQPLERIPEETRHLPDDTNLFGKKVKVINQIEGFEKTINIGDMLLVKPLVYGQFELLKNKKRVMWGSNSTLIGMVNKGDIAVMSEKVKSPVEPILEENVSDGKVEPLQNGEREYKGQFPSKNCECHIQEPYGFVPEADCPEHDTKQFSDFLKELLSQSKKEGEMNCARHIYNEITRRLQTGELKKVIDTTEKGNGIKTSVSVYDRDRWLPERTLKAIFYGYDVFPQSEPLESLTNQKKDI